LYRFQETMRKRVDLVWQRSTPFVTKNEQKKASSPYLLLPVPQLLLNGSTCFQVSIPSETVMRRRNSDIEVGSLLAQLVFAVEGSDGWRTDTRDARIGRVTFTFTTPP